MYKNAVQYKGSYLAPGSRCLELYQAKKMKELDALLKELDRKEEELLKRHGSN